MNKENNSPNNSEFIYDGNKNQFAVCQKLYKWITENIPEGSTIVELGSGVGTIELCKKYKVYSIEDNKEWIGHAKDSNYIYSPLKNYGDHKWFDEPAILNSIPADYDLLLIDGPHGNRVGFHMHMDLFKKDIPWIFDDTHAPWNLEEANKCASILGKKVITHLGVKKKKFSTVE